MNPRLSLKSWKWGIALLALAAFAAAPRWACAAMFRIGSAERTVIAIMGLPDSRGEPIGRNEEVWIYRSSSVTFRNGYVVGWDNRGRNLMIYMGSAKKGAPPLTVGATPEAVVDLLGTPDAITPGLEDGVETWTYGASSITFIRGRVEHWISKAAEIRETPLPPPKPPAKFVRMGSTKAKVAAVLGRPGSKAALTNLDEEIWTWRENTVTFHGDTISGWSNVDNSLSIFMGFPSDSAASFSEGSSRQEVVDNLGTPLEIIPLEALSMELWIYSMATVTFSHGRVFSWNDVAPKHIQDRLDYCLVAEEELPDTEVAAWAHSLDIAPTRMPHLIKGKSLPTPLLRDEQGCAWPYRGEDGSFYGQISTQTGRPKTVYIAGFYRPDGTYIRSHYRCPSASGNKR